MTVIAQQTLEFKDFSKGMNTYDPDIAVPPGYYVDAQNMVLTNKYPVTIAGLTKLNTTTAPNDEVIVWAEPYTSGSPAVTTMLVATSAGTLYKYTVSTDTWTTLMQGLSTTKLTWTHVPFRGVLLFSNGSDPIFKYNGTNVLPVGAVLVADMESDEAWTGAGTLLTSPLTQIREGAQAIKIFPVTSAIMTYTASTNFTTGLNGAPDFGASDLIKMNIFKSEFSSTGTVRLRFRDFTTPTTKHFEKSFTVSASGWNRVSAARSTFTDTGTASWATIGSIQIFVDSGDFFVFDDIYEIYALAPPAGGLIDLYNQQLMVAGIAADLVSLQYSDAGTPDYFPTANIARFSGGRNALEKTDQITALRSYFDELIVGKVNSAWTFSGTGTNVSISALPLTLGIDSHRGIAETPWALHYLFENNIFGSRLTSRGLVSTNISSLLQKIDGSAVENTVAIRNDKTHLIRWAFTTTDSSATTRNDVGLLYDYIADAWVSAYTPDVRYYFRATVSGNREIVAVSYDGYMRRVDVGTTFDGDPIVSWVTLPWQKTGAPEKTGNIVRWVNGTAYVSGTATVIVEGRFADNPTEIASATYTTLGTINAANPDEDKGYFDIGRTSRWIQLRFRATSLSFALQPPVIIGYNDTSRRV